jgi:hypothetical protein
MEEHASVFIFETFVDDSSSDVFCSLGGRGAFDE